MSASVNQPGEHDECHPLAPIPAWWSAFLFQILNPRQVCMYAYLAMLCSQKDSCHPTTDQIRGDLGLYSTSMVFEALAVLEELRFIARERQTFPGTRPRRNVYRLQPCESTLLRLLEADLIDGFLRPVTRDGTNEGPSPESERLIQDGLEVMLGDEFPRYAAAPAEQKRDVLIEFLQKHEVREEAD
jgi:DNA-binding PadR family transcriptional regulator